MTQGRNRWGILFSGVVANLCQGVAYTSSIFMIPLGEALQRPKEAWSSEWGIIFAMSLAFLPVGMVLGGKLADSGRTRLTIGLGAVVYGLGLILAGFGYGVAWTALTLGVMTSVGSGLAYGTVVGAVVRWFPDRRGLASGIAVAAVGVGPIVLAPLASWLMAGHGVLGMFTILGVLCLICMGAAALYITNPPAGYVPAGFTAQAPGATAQKSAEGLTWREVIRQRVFWLLYVCYFCGVFAGVLVNGLAAPIAMELAGFDRAGATFAVMLFALASAGGRVLWGFLSDRLGRIVMIAAAFVITAAAMFLLYNYVRVPGVFMPCLFAAGLCYGGVFGTFPSLSADQFGVKHAAVNLAVLFTSFSLVAILAPQVVGVYRAAGAQQYPKAFLVAGCVAVIGAVLSIIVGKSLKKSRVEE